MSLTTVTISYDSSIEPAIALQMAIDNGAVVSGGSNPLSKEEWIAAVIGKYVAPALSRIQQQQQEKIFALMQANPTLTYADALASVTA